MMGKMDTEKAMGMARGREVEAMKPCPLALNPQHIERIGIVIGKEDLQIPC
jgi:hypothetical protein